MGDLELKFGEFFLLTNQRVSVIKQKIIEQHGRVEDISLQIGEVDLEYYDDTFYLY